MPRANLIGRMDGAEHGCAAPSCSARIPTPCRPVGASTGRPACWPRSKSCARCRRPDTPRHAIEVVDFLAEEPSEYGVSCVGSRAMAGALDDKMLAYTESGR